MVYLTKMFQPRGPSVFGSRNRSSPPAPSASAAGGKAGRYRHRNGSYPTLTVIEDLALDKVAVEVGKAYFCDSETNRHQCDRNEMHAAATVAARLFWARRRP